MPGLLARIAMLSGDAASARRLLNEAVRAELDPLDAYHFAGFLLAPTLQSEPLERLLAPDAVRAQELLAVTVPQQPFADASALHGIALRATGATRVGNEHSVAVELPRD